MRPCRSSSRCVSSDRHGPVGTGILRMPSITFQQQRQALVFGKALWRGLGQFSSCGSYRELTALEVGGLHSPSFQHRQVTKASRQIGSIPVQAWAGSGRWRTPARSRGYRSCLSRHAVARTIILKFPSSEAIELLRQLVPGRGFARGHPSLKISQQQTMIVSRHEQKVLAATDFDGGHVALQPRRRAYEDVEHISALSFTGADHHLQREAE